MTVTTEDERYRKHLENSKKEASPGMESELSCSNWSGSIKRSSRSGESDFIKKAVESSGSSGDKSKLKWSSFGK